MLPVWPFRCLSCCLFAAFFFFGSARAAEAPAALWVQFIGGKNLDIESPRVVSDPLGGFFFLSGGERPLIRFNEAGQTLWSIEPLAGFNDLQKTEAADVLSSGEIVAAFVASGASGARLFGEVAAAGGINLARLNANGNLVSLWPVTNGWINAVKALEDGGFLVAGFGNDTLSIGPSQINLGAGGFFLAKFTDALQWVRIGHSSGGVFENSIRDISLDASGDIFVSGTATGGWIYPGANVAGPGVFLARLDSSGLARWGQIAATNASFQFATKTTDGPTVLLASKSSGEQMMVSVSRDGAQQWQKTLAAPAMEVAAGDAIYVVGTENPARWFFEALDGQGNSLWRRADFGRVPYFGRSVAILKSGRVVAAGTLPQSGIFIDDFFPHDFSLIGVSYYHAFLAEFDPTANAAPVIREQPSPYSGIAGERMTLRAGIYSAQPVTFKWLKNNEEIPGETGSTLVRSSLQPGDAGDYQLVATSIGGEVRSQPVRVSINTMSIATIAGSGEAGFVDSFDPLAAKFKAPRFPVVLPNSVLVVESSNRVIRRIALSGVTTFGGTNAPLFSAPAGIAFQQYSELGPKILLAESGANGIRPIRVDLNDEQPLSINPAEGASVLRQPTSVATAEGLEYRVVAEAEGSKIWMSTEGDVTLLTGGEAGYVDGPAVIARFGAISGLAMDMRGNVYVCDKGNHAIRKIALDGTVSTLAGTNSPALLDGVGPNARFNSPSGIAVDSDGNLFVTDTGNNALRRISRGGDVTTLTTDLNAPEGVAVRADGSLVVADTGNNRIREVRFTAGATATALTVSISLTGGFAITVSGPVGDYFIESTDAVPTGNGNWQIDALISIVDMPVVQPLDRPDGSRFYRARSL